MSLEDEDIPHPASITSIRIARMYFLNILTSISSSSLGGTLLDSGGRPHVPKNAEEVDHFSKK
jgi:hypothetical protein